MTISIRQNKIGFPFWLTFFFYPCQGVVAAEVEVGVAAEREEGKEGNAL